MKIPAPPLDHLFEAFAQCWDTATQQANPDDIEAIWDSAYAQVRDQDRAVYKVANATQQLEFIQSARKAVDEDWVLWVIVRLSQCEPFRAWREWSMASRTNGSLAVGQTMTDSHLLPFRVFVLSKKGLRPAHTKVWPYGIAPETPPENILRRTSWALCWCCVRNLLGLSVEPLPLVLLSFAAMLLAGLFTWGVRSEVALEEFLKAFICVSGCLWAVAAWEVSRELFLVKKEGWLHLWNNSLIRVVGDCNDAPTLITGDSYSVALLLASFKGLTERVTRNITPGRKPSRLWKTMNTLSENLPQWAATGRLAGWFIGGCVRNVGDIELKRRAVDRAGIPNFLVPFSFATVRKWLRQMFGRETDRARLRICLFLPSVALKLSSRFRWRSVLAAGLMLLIFIGFFDAFRLMASSSPPALKGVARWWPRTGNRRDVNLLQLEFTEMPGRPVDFFVTVEGDTGPPTGLKYGERKTPLEVRVRGQASLAFDEKHPQSASVEVRLRAAGAAPDPHRLAINLFQRRSVLGLTLPPRRISSFGLPKIEIQEAEQP